MTPENFVYWLQGHLEIGNSESLSSDQVKIIKDHLKLVFKKETPDRTFGDTPSYCTTLPQNIDWGDEPAITC